MSAPQLDQYSWNIHENKYNECKLMYLPFKKFYSKIFSICLFLNDSNYQEKTTKFFAYLAGVEESIHNVQNNINNLISDEYGIEIYLNLKIVEYAKKSQIKEYSPINWEEPVYDMVKKLILLMIARNNVNPIIYDCGKYNDRIFFGAVVRFFPFFDPKYQEIHIRDTDSCFGTPGDYHWIKKWHSSKTEYYYYASYRTEHLSIWQKQSQLDYLGIIANSYGGIPLNIADKNQFFEKHIYQVCDNFYLENKQCAYGVDEVILAFYMYPYMKHSVFKIPIKSFYPIYYYHRIKDINTGIICSNVLTDIGFYHFSVLTGISSYILNFNFGYNHNEPLNVVELNVLHLIYFTLFQMFIYIKQYSNIVSKYEYKKFKIYGQYSVEILQKYNNALDIKKLYKIVSHIYSQFEQKYTIYLSNFFSICSETGMELRQKLLKTLAKNAPVHKFREIYQKFFDSTLFANFQNPLKYSLLYLSEYDREVNKLMAVYGDDYISYAKFVGSKINLNLGIIQTISITNFIGVNLNNPSEKVIYREMPNSSRFRNYENEDQLNYYKFSTSIDDLMKLQKLMEDPINLETSKHLQKIIDIGINTKVPHHSGFDIKISLKKTNQYYDTAYTYISQYIEGITSTVFFTNYGNISNLVYLYRKMVEILNFFHKNNLKYGDIHPDNIIIDEQRQPILIDMESVSELNKETFRWGKFGLIQISKDKYATQNNSGYGKKSSYGYNRNSSFGKKSSYGYHKNSSFDFGQINKTPVGNTFGTVDSENEFDEYVINTFGIPMEYSQKEQEKNYLQRNISYDRLCLRMTLLILLNHFPTSKENKTEMINLIDLLADENITYLEILNKLPK